MVGLVIVSHSKQLAEDLRDLVQHWTTSDLPLVVAAGTGDNHDEIGTDTVHIAEAMRPFCVKDGAVVVMDIGSAVLSAEVALELLEPEERGKIRLCPGPLVEGVVAGAAHAAAGGTLDGVYSEALQALAVKAQQLQPEGVPAEASKSPRLAASLADTHEIVLSVENEHGLHARPIAALVQTAAKFDSEVDLFNESSGRGPASARSLTSIALLQVGKGDRIRVSAKGADALDTLEAISSLVRNHFGEVQIHPLETAATKLGSFPDSSVQTSFVSSSKAESAAGRAIPASEGIAIGPLLSLQSLPIAVGEMPVLSPLANLEKLKEAMQGVQHRFSEQASPKKSAAPGNTMEILAAEALILSDPIILEKVESLIDKTGTSAARAWQEVTEELVRTYSTLDDAYLRARAADVLDISRLVLQELSGQQFTGPIHPSPSSILFTRELFPSDAAACDPESVLGVITSEGSPASHSAILLRTLGIPMVVGARGLDDAVSQGQLVAMDGATGEIWIDPDSDVTESLRIRKKDLSEHRAAVRARASQPSITLDGVQVEVLGIAGSVIDSRAAALNGAEGIGLLRTELLFLSRKVPPSAQEQEEALRTIFDPVASGMKIIVRTIDAGADKPLPFLAQLEEHNPFLGVRGIRLSLRYPDFFREQLKSILLAGADANVWIMLPMVTSNREIAQTRSLLKQIHEELLAQRRPHRWPVHVGIMIEVPSAALLAEQFAETADFFSIGTNDLTQYVLAAERGNASLSELQDALHPAVLRLIKSVVVGAQARQRPVSVCGDAASDPIAAAVFFGLGIRSLSVRPNQVPEIKALFGRLRASDLADLAGKVLTACDAGEVRSEFQKLLSQKN